MSRPDLAIPVPFHSLSGRVPPDWIDGNDHMNVSRYDKTFDEAESAFYASCGIDAGFQAKRRGLFRLEKHIRYERELRLGAGIAVTTQLLWTDLKRIQIFHQLWNTDDDYRAATMECMAIHINLETRKAMRIDDPEVGRRIAAMADEHASLPVPQGVGRWVSRHPIPHP